MSDITYMFSVLIIYICTIF